MDPGMVSLEGPGEGQGWESKRWGTCSGRGALGQRE